MSGINLVCEKESVVGKSKLREYRAEFSHINCLDKNRRIRFGIELASYLSKLGYVLACTTYPEGSIYTVSILVEGARRYRSLLDSVSRYWMDFLGKALLSTRTFF